MLENFLLVLNAACDVGLLDAVHAVVVGKTFSDFFAVFSFGNGKSFRHFFMLYATIPPPFNRKKNTT